MSNDFPTLCLNMIVKNESKIIIRLLNSVVSLIDCYCICDTGSTDNTKELISSYFENKNIPGKIIEEPFKNFCHNRNFALTACLGMSDYILLLDADMVLEIYNFEKKKLLDASSFTILQGNDSFYYQNVRIIKNNGLYKYVGVTHEYVATPSNNTVENLTKDMIFINDLYDGGSKQDKFERDILLLSNGIQEEPDNSRYHFYLANSYHDSGKFDQAIDMYKKRIKFGGWREEVWYSYYKMGLCLKKLGRTEEAICCWLDGYDFYQDRLEGLYEIIKHYRIHSKHKLANIYYKIAVDILNKNHNRDEYLFLHNDVYSYQIFYEYTIFSNYLGINNIDNEIIKIFTWCKNAEEICNLLSNMKFYKFILFPSSIIKMEGSFTCDINKLKIDFTSSSSCLIPKPSGSGYLTNIRYVNYHIQSNGQYVNCDNHIISMNKYVEFDSSMNILTEKWQEFNFDGRQYIGVEDVKIFTDIETNKLLFIGTGYHQTEKIGIVTGEYDVENCLMKCNEIVPNFNNATCEKNWTFVDYKGQTHVVYKWFPLQLCSINHDTNELSLLEKKEMPNFFRMVRGSTCGFKYSKTISEKSNGNISIEIMDHEIWFVTHFVSYENPRHYYHMLAIFDTDMNLLRYSAPFKFEGEPIEYCLSIVVEDERVLINYSTWDRTTRIGIYEKKYIDSIVKYS